MTIIKFAKGNLPEEIILIINKKRVESLSMSELFEYLTEEELKTLFTKKLKKINASLIDIAYELNKNNNKFKKVQ